MAAAEGLQLARAYIQIIPTTKNIKGSISSAMNAEAEAAGESSGRTAGSRFAAGLGTALKVAGAVTGVMAAAAAALGKAVLDAYGNYEQLVGGVETLFGQSSDTVLQYANRAYQTAQISANDYMETVTSFSASLLQSLGGDTAKAAEYADMAIIDMADNANKMGTSMESIQYAYQGFAKQNYTMLDNLKLGYGGTKSEMERLIQDAAKLTDVQEELGVTVDANSMSFENIVAAIHVMQGSLGIAGTSAEEASKQSRIGQCHESGMGKLDHGSGRQ